MIETSYLQHCRCQNPLDLLLASPLTSEHSQCTIAKLTTGINPYNYFYGSKVPFSKNEHTKLHGLVEIIPMTECTELDTSRNYDDIMSYPLLFDY